MGIEQHCSIPIRRKDRLLWWFGKAEKAQKEVKYIE
jgi:hypothetical protein